MRFGRVILVRLFAGAVDIAACPNLTDVRACMSAYRRIPDMVQRCVERVLMTQSRSCWSQSSKPSCNAGHVGRLILPSVVYAGVNVGRMIHHKGWKTAPRGVNVHRRQAKWGMSVLVSVG